MRLSTEAKVGLLITISFTVFIILIGTLAKININQSGYRITLIFSFLNDLHEGAAVKIGGGIEIGEVRAIRQSNDKTEVELWIDNKYHLSRATTFAIFTTGIIGEKYINVIVPAIADNEGYLQDGDVKYGIDPASFDRMMQTFQSFLQDKDGGEILAEIFQNSNSFVGNMNELVEDNKYDVKSSVVMTKATIENLSHQTDLLMNHLNRLGKNVADLSEQNKDDINITLKNLSETSKSLNDITYRLDKGRGTIGRLLTDEEIYNNLRDASIYFRDLAYDLKQDPSKLFFKTNR